MSTTILPPCQQRGRRLPGDRYVCQSNRILHRGAVSPETCLVCPAANLPNREHRTKPKRRNGSAQQASRDVVDATPEQFPCVHRGKELGSKRKCNLCGQRGQEFQVFGCSIHGECSIGRRHSKVRACVGCDDQKEPGQPSATVKQTKTIRVGWIVPQLTLGGVTRGIETTIRHSDPTKVSFSGIVTSSKNYCTDKQTSIIQDRCRIIEAGEFRQNVQALVDSSDVLMLWGAFGPGAIRDLEAVDWKGKPVVLRSHGECDWTRRMIEKLLPVATHFMAVSESAAGSFPEHVRDKVHVLYNGVDLERCSPTEPCEAIRNRWGIKPDEIAVGYYGRFSNEKRPLAAAEVVKQLGPPYSSVYCGNPWMSGKGAASLLTLDPNSVQLPTTDQIGDVLEGLDVFVLASRQEGHAQSLIECWQHGVPVVATPVGAVPELEERYGQMVVRVPVDATPEQLADAVQQALSWENAMTIQNARNVARRAFTATAMSRRFERFVESVVKQPKPRTRQSRKPLRVALITHGLWIGGAERWIASLVKHSDPSRVQWTGVVNVGRSGAHPDLCREIAEKTELHGVAGPEPKWPGRSFDETHFTQMHPKIEQAVDAVCRDADLIISWGTPRKWEYAKRFNKPFILVAHTALKFDGDERLAIPPEIHLAAVSEPAKNFFVHRDGYHGQPIEVVWNGVEPERCEPRIGRTAQRQKWGVRDDEIVVGYLGRQMEEKRYIHAAQAVTELPEDYQAVYCGYCCQTGKVAAPDLQALIDQYPERIAAYPPETHVGDMLAGFDCMMSTGHRETFCLSMVEAWIAGVPTIAANTGIVPELTEQFGPVAIVVPDNPTPKQLAEAVMRATGPEGREIAERAQRIAQEQLTAEKMAERWADYFDRISKK